MRSLLFLAFGISAAFALTCYSDVKEMSVKPEHTLACLNDSPFCTSITATVGGRSVVTYGCDNDMSRQCKKNECFTNNFNEKVCCCSKDYCNGSSMTSSLFASSLSLISIFVLGRL